MDGRKIFDAVGEIDDDILQDAEAAPEGGKRRIGTVVRWLAAVAAFAVVLLGGYLATRIGSPNTPEPVPPIDPPGPTVPGDKKSDIRIAYETAPSGDRAYLTGTELLLRSVELSEKYNNPAAVCVVKVKELKLDEINEYHRVNLELEVEKIIKSTSAFTFSEGETLCACDETRWFKGGDNDEDYRVLYYEGEVPITQRDKSYVVLLIYTGDYDTPYSADYSVTAHSVPMGDGTVSLSYLAEQYELFNLTTGIQRLFEGIMREWVQPESFPSDDELRAYFGREAQKDEARDLWAATAERLGCSLPAEKPALTVADFEKIEAGISFKELVESLGLPDEFASTDGVSADVGQYFGIDATAFIFIDLENDCTVSEVIVSRHLTEEIDV